MREEQCMLLVLTSDRLLMISHIYKLTNCELNNWIERTSESSGGKKTEEERGGQKRRLSKFLWLFFLSEHLWFFAEKPILNMLFMLTVLSYVYKLFPLLKLQRFIFIFWREILLFLFQQKSSWSSLDDMGIVVQHFGLPGLHEANRNCHKLHIKYIINLIYTSNKTFFYVFFFNYY